MMAKFYLVYLDKNPNTSDDDVTDKMNKALDWYRIDPRVWILYSSSTAEKLYARLSPLAKDDGNIFISELNLSARQGWMKKSFWDWIKKERSS